MSRESPSPLGLCGGLRYCMKGTRATTHKRKGQGGSQRSPWEELCYFELVSYLQNPHCSLYAQSTAHWQARHIPSHHFCPLFSYIEDWQTSPGKSQTVNIRLCRPFGFCHNSPALPLLHKSSQRHKQMADGCAPTTKFKQTEVYIPWHPLGYSVSFFSFFFFFTLEMFSLCLSLWVYKSNLQT